MKIKITESNHPLNEIGPSDVTYGQPAKIQGDIRKTFAQMGSKEAFKTTVQMLDPTGVTSIPDIPPAYAAYEKNPTFKNAVFLTLAVFAAIPVAGKLAKGVSKAPKLLQYLKKFKSVFSSRCGLNESGTQQIGCAVSRLIDPAIQATERVPRSKFISTGSQASRAAAPLVQRLASIVIDKKMYIDDDGRQFIIVKFGDAAKIFYKSTGKGSPKLNTGGMWLPMQGITLDMARTSEGGVKPIIWYAKIPGKVPEPGTPLRKISEELGNLENQFQQAGKTFQQAWSEMRDSSIDRGTLNFSGRTPTDPIEKSKKSVEVSTDSINRIAAFNQWAEKAGAIWDRVAASGEKGSRKIELPGTKKDGYDLVAKAIRLFDLQESTVFKSGAEKMIITEENLRVIILDELRKTLFKEGLRHHYVNRIPVHESIYRVGSPCYFNVIKQARDFYKKGLYEVVNEEERHILENTSLGEWVMFEGEEVPLDFPMYAENLEEAKKNKKKKKDPPIGKPSRNTGSGKKYKVFVRNPKTGKIKKITYGDAKGGLKGGWNSAEARKSFASRHKCAQKKDRTKAGYWACRAHKDFGPGIGRFW